MSITIGSNNISEVYIGSTRIQSIYHGADLCYSLDQGEAPGFYADDDELLLGWEESQVDVTTNFPEDESYKTAEHAPYKIMTDYNDSHTKKISKVVIRHGIRNIGSRCFMNCSWLKRITLPRTITAIYYDGFANCTGLEEVHFQGNVDKWVQIYFRNYGANPMSRGIEIDLEKSETFMYPNCNLYFNDLLINSIEISPSITSISSYAFVNCNQLTKINTLDSEGSGNLTSIGDRAFYGCNSLLFIQLPDTFNSYGWEVFYGCRSLINIPTPMGEEILSNLIPSGLKSIGYRTFAGTYIGERPVKIPAAISEIPYGLFMHSQIQSVYPETDFSTWRIRKQAFYNCRELKTITFPKYLKEIDDYAFTCCPLTNIGPTFANPTFDNLETLGKYAFSECKFYTPTTMKFSKLSVLREGAFFKSPALYSLEFTGNLTTIESKAIAYCPSFHEIKLPDSVTDIAEDAFLETSGYITRFTGSVDALSTFDNLPNLTYLKITSGNGPISKNFGDYLSTIDLWSGMENIGSGIFEGQTRLTSLTVPWINFWFLFGSTTSQDLSMLSYIYINRTPQSIITLNRGCFKDLTSLLGVYLIDGATKMDLTDSSWLNVIPIECFSGCSSIRKIAIGPSVTSIHSKAFYNCTSLSTISYWGTIADWNNVTKEPQWHEGVPATVVHCLDGDINI